MMNRSPSEADISPSAPMGPRTYTGASTGSIFSTWRYPMVCWPPPRFTVKPPSVMLPRPLPSVLLEAVHDLLRVHLRVLGFHADGSRGVFDGEGGELLVRCDDLGAAARFEIPVGVSVGLTVLADDLRMVISARLFGHFARQRTLAPECPLHLDEGSGGRAGGVRRARRLGASHHVRVAESLLSEIEKNPDGDPREDAESQKYYREEHMFLLCFELVFIAV